MTVFSCAVREVKVLLRRCVCVVLPETAVCSSIYCAHTGSHPRLDLKRKVNARDPVVFVSNELQSTLKGWG